MCFEKLADFNKNDETTVSNEVSQDVTNTIEVAEMETNGTRGGYPITYKEPGVFDATPTHLVRIIDIYAADYTEPTVVSSDMFESILSNSTFISNRLSNFTYFTATLRATVVVNGSPTVAGRFLLAFQPWLVYPDININMMTNDNDLTLPQAYTMPHIEIDPSVSKTYTIDLPCPTVTGLYNLAKANEGLQRAGSYRVWWVPIVPPIGGTATTPDVSNTIYFSFADISPGALHNSGVADMELEAQEEEETPKLSSMLTTASGLADKASSFPVIGPYASTFSSVAQGASKALNMFGFAKPTAERMQPIVNVRNFANMSHVDGDFEGYTLSSNVKNGVAIGDVMGFDKMDDMSIPSLCSRNCYVGKFAVNPTTPPGTFVTSYRVSPALCPFEGDPTVAANTDLTPLAHMTSLFSYWHGTLDFEFEIVCTAYHRCTLLFAYSPYRFTTPTFSDALNVLNNTNVTVSGNTTVKMSIPWRRPFPWLPTFVSNRAFGAHNGDVANGTIYVYVVNPVTSNGSTDPIEVIVKLKSDDIQFALPTLGNWNNPDPGKIAVVQWSGLDPDAAPEAAIAKDTPVVGGEPVHNSVVEEGETNPMFGDCFGENVALSTKSLSMKMAYHTQLYFNSGQRITVPNSPLWVTDAGIPTWIYTDPSRSFWTYRDVCSLGYLGCRGSTNVGLVSKYIIPGGTAATDQSVYVANANFLARCDGVSSPATSEINFAQFSGNGYTHQNTSGEGKNVYFNIPHNLRFPMKILNRETNFTTSAKYGDSYNVGFEKKQTADLGCMGLCTGAGDDFSFIWYLAPTRVRFYVPQDKV